MALLADILSAAMGISIALTIAVEVVGRMVLLIPEAVRNLIEKGRKEGRQEERTSQLTRRKEALSRFGIEVDGVRVLPMTPEVVAFLNGEDWSEGP